ncbi:hypothetical protein BH20VER2_BH20VER2_14060 [soil metagenome]
MPSFDIVSEVDPPSLRYGAVAWNWRTARC